MPSTRSKTAAKAAVPSRASGPSAASTMTKTQSTTRARAKVTAKASTKSTKSTGTEKDQGHADDDDGKEVHNGDDDDDDDEGLGGGEYFEHQRLANIQRNQSLFADLIGGTKGVGTASAILGGAQAKKRTAASRRSQAATSSDQDDDDGDDDDDSENATAKPTHKKAKRTETPPVRRSSRASLRLRGLNPPGHVPSTDVNATTTASEDQASTSLDQSAAAVLSLADTTHALDRASQLLASLAAQGTQVHDADNDNDDDQPDPVTGSLAAQFASLRIRHTPATVKLTPSRIATLVVAPRDDRYLVIAGDKQGTLALSDLTSHVSSPAGDSDEIPGAIQLKPHADAISALHFTSPTRLVSASYDGTLRVLDVATQQFVLGARMARGVHVQALDAAPQTPSVVWYSTDAGGLGVLDLRMPVPGGGHPNVYHSGLCDKKIGSVSVHPVRSERVLVASNDTYARVYDVRYGFSGTTTTDGFTETKERVWYKHAYSCTAAYWKPHDGLGLCTTSYDDLVRVWNGDVLGDQGGQEYQDATEMKAPTFALRHDNKTGRWVTLFRAKYHPTLDNCILIGNMQRHVDVVDASQGRVVATLGDPGITAVPAVTAVHPTAVKWARVVVGANASGKVSVWTPSPHRSGADDDEEEEEAEV